MTELETEASQQIINLFLEKNDCFSIANYHVNKKKIGMGSFATIYHGIEKDIAKEVAIKRIHVKDTKKLAPQITKEIEIMKDLSHPNIMIPEMGSIFSVNEGNLKEFPAGVQAYVDYCKGNDKAEKRPYSARYIGSLIADFHRNLLKGGIYMYPPTEKAPNGKLRLLYECNPMSFLVEQAGGKSHTGKHRVMEVTPEQFHQRVRSNLGAAL